MYNSNEGMVNWGLLYGFQQPFASGEYHTAAGQATQRQFLQI
jgi:hypothetical protein